MKFLLLFTCLTLMLPISAQAEYRAFLLAIKSTDGNVVRTLTSTLDPDQYRGYFHLQPGETITYTDTWMCWGRTENFQPICPSPHVPTEPAPPNPT